MARRRVTSFGAMAGLAAALVGGITIPFLGPRQPPKGFRYELSPGAYSEYRLQVSEDAATSIQTYRFLFVGERKAGKAGEVWTLEHWEDTTPESHRVIRFEVLKKDWRKFMGDAVKNPLRVLRIRVQTKAGETVEIDSEPALSVFGKRLGPGFLYLEDFGKATAKAKPEGPKKVSVGKAGATREIEAYDYELVYETEDYLMGELPQKVNSQIVGKMTASDAVPFGIVRLEVDKLVRRVYDIPGVKAPTQTMKLKVTLSLVDTGLSGKSAFQTKGEERPAPAG